MEDDEWTLASIEAEARSAGYEFQLAASLGAAMERVRTERFDLVVTDLVIPDDSDAVPESEEEDLYAGLRFLRFLRHEVRLTTSNQVPVVVLTVARRPVRESPWLQREATLVLSKLEVYEPAELFAILRSLIEA
ncbi:MAG: response regulator [Thermoanaerobaculia bacterium]|nr:response regulator [Thermoanaerobaculia bacterium]